MMERPQKGLSTGESEQGGVRSLHALILDRERGCMQGLRGDLSLFLPSPSPAGQGADLEHRGKSPQPIHPWCKVNVLRGLGKPQGEVLLQGGKDEEGLERAKLSPRQRHFPAGVRERVSMRRALQSTWLPHRENLRIFACSFT